MKKHYRDRTVEYEKRKIPRTRDPAISKLILSLLKPKLVTILPKKTCRKCKTTYPYRGWYFYKSGKSPAGSVRYENVCKSCRRNEARDNRKKLTDKVVRRMFRSSVKLGTISVSQKIIKLNRSYIKLSRLLKQQNNGNN